METFDIIIIGAGPAGLCAALYAGRAGARTLLVEGTAAGGQLQNTFEIVNYLGFDEIDGVGLANKFRAHAMSFGAVTVRSNALSVKRAGDVFEVVCANRAEPYRGISVIAATGSRRRRLGVPGEEELTGRGVSYCAVCDGGFFRGGDVAVIGGGDTAAEDALYLADLCRKVYIIHRREELRAARTLAERVLERENIEIIYNANVAAIGAIPGNGNRVGHVALREGGVIEVAGVFVAVGEEPLTAYLPPEVEKTPEGAVITDEYCATGVAGLFAAGDIRKKPLRQIITAVADGAVAASAAAEYVKKSYK